jgi:hypothetical protein
VVEPELFVAVRV